MFATAVIVFREVLEAALILSIVAAATRNVAGRNLWLVAGVAGGIAGSAVVAGFATEIADALDGVGQEIFNASVLGVAVLMLGWHNIWMQRHGRELAAEMSRVGSDVVAGNKSMLAVTLAVALAVLREGSEVVLFLYGIASGGASHVGSRPRRHPRTCHWKRSRMGLVRGPSHDPHAASLLDHKLADPLSRRWHVGHGRKIPDTGGHCSGARQCNLGHISLALGRQRRRGNPARAGRLRRATVGDQLLF